MKVAVRFIRNSTIVAVAFFVGYFVSPKTDEIGSENVLRLKQMGDLRDVEKKQLGTDEKFPSSRLESSIRFQDENPEVRLRAMVTAWYDDRLSLYSDTIDTMAERDVDPYVRRLAAWLSGGGGEPTLSAEVVSTQEDDLDMRIQRGLVEQPSQSAHQDDLGRVDEDLIAPLATLQPDEQQDYLHDLAYLDDDAAVDALSELVHHPDEHVQTIAVDELLGIMERKTGHFEQVVQVLTDHRFYLTEAQEEKFQRATDSMMVP